MSEWPDLQILHAVAATGSLAAAGRMLGIRHTTVGRRLDALERIAGDKLVLRLPRGTVLTPLGEELAGVAAAVEEMMATAGRKARQELGEISGTVSISAAPLVATTVLASSMAPFLAAHPDLTVIVDSSSSSASLFRSEADIALRLGDPSDSGLLSRRLGSIHLALYATPEVAGQPKEEWRFVGYNDALAHLPHHRWFEDLVGSRRVALRTNDVHAHREAAAAGVGVSMLPCAFADSDQRLLKIPGYEPPSRPLWMLVHPDIRRSNAVSAVIGNLVELFGRDGRFARGAST